MLSSKILAIFALVVAVCAITPVPFTSPEMGGNITMNRQNNVTWTAATIPSDKVTLKFAFDNTDMSDQYEKADGGHLMFECIENDGLVDLDLRLPIDTMQDIADELLDIFELDWDVNVDTVVNHMVSAINGVPLEDRNITLTLTQCNGTDVYFESYAFLSSARSVGLGLVAILAAVAFLL